MLIKVCNFSSNSGEDEHPRREGVSLTERCTTVSRAVLKQNGKKETANSQFIWRPGSKPPTIQSHTDAKLCLLEAYLDRYFDVVCAMPQMDLLRIALVDSFAGGGQFRSGGATRSGSPMVMIEAVRRAEARVNASRRKPLRIEAKFFFVDSDSNAIDYLKATIGAAGLPQHLRDSIAVEVSASSDALPTIVRQISEWSPAGRSIFFLDQCGYTDAPNRDARLIYRSLPKSEVIVTYNFGAIYDYMNAGARFLAAMAPLELTAQHLRALLKEREAQAGRFFAGRLLGKLFKQNVGSKFASRFFLRSEDAGRDLWFVHYSKVPRSRLVMNEAHWAIKNASVTQGEAGLDMLGFRPNWEYQIPIDFGFDESDEGLIHNALVAELPRWLERFAPDSESTVEALLALTADDMVATQAQFNVALKALEVEGEIQVLTPSGGRKRPSAELRSSHRIALPRQYTFGF